MLVINHSRCAGARRLAGGGSFQGVLYQEDACSASVPSTFSQDPRFPRKEDLFTFTCGIRHFQPLPLLISVFKTLTSKVLANKIISPEKEIYRTVYSKLKLSPSRCTDIPPFLLYIEGREE